MISSIKLKKNSLLLRYVRMFSHVGFYPKNIDSDGNPKDLCSLIRALMLAVVHSLLTGMLYACILTTCLFFIYALTTPFQYFISLMFFKGYYAISIEPSAYILGTVEVFFLTAFLINSLFNRLRTYLYKLQHKTHSIADNKQPNIFIQYIKDKHNKVCRSIDLED